jgi:hypothetical protein
MLMKGCHCHARAALGRVVLIVISSHIYIVKTVNKASFLGDNNQSSDFGANNLVPLVHVIICL